MGSDTDKPKTSSEQQKWNVKRNVAISVVSGITFANILYHILPDPTDGDRKLTGLDKLIYTLRWNAFSMIPIFAFLQRVGNARFTTSAIDPARGASEQYVTMYNNILRNTFEQFTISFTLQLILSTFLEGANLKVIPVVVILFVCGRFIFDAGYRSSDATYRTLGHPWTYFTSGGMTVYVLYSFFTKGPMSHN